MTARLSIAALSALPANVRRPNYDLTAARVGIVHLGVGAFHRAHQAVYLDDLIAAGERNWAVCGASLRASATADALVPQDGLYTLAIRDGAREELRVIGALRDVVVAPHDPKLLLDKLCASATKIVSLTITEKGYCLDRLSGTLDMAHPDIQADFANLRLPHSALGFLVEAIRRRRADGAPPFTVLTCDNLPDNGAFVARALAGFAKHFDLDLARFIEGEVRCPSTMVDRIVPATTDADRARIDAHLGMSDHWPVVTEPFSQWVIEDNFGPGGRPRFEDVGVQMVNDVAPFEKAKLRLLNGAHSALAYLGGLAGFPTIGEVMADASLADFAEGIMMDAQATLAPLPGADIALYRKTLLARFRNPALLHRTAQIAMDGSQKLPQRWADTVRDRLAAGLPIARFALGFAAWMRYNAGHDDAGRVLEIKDPLADRLRAAAGKSNPAAIVESFVTIEDIFGTDLPHDSRFVKPVQQALERLISEGAHRTVKDLAVQA